MRYYEPCPHTDCVYRNERKSAEVQAYNCSYMERTGQSRIKGLSREQREDKENCPKYIHDDSKPMPIPRKHGLSHERKKALRLAREREMCKLYDKGMSDGQIAKEIHVSEDTVKGWRRKKALPPHRQRSKCDWGKALELYRNGMTDNEIANAIGCMVKTVQQWRWKNDLPNNAQGKYDWGKALELYREGMRDMEIAEVLGCSINTVTQWRHARKLPAWGKRKKDRTTNYCTHYMQQGLPVQAKDRGTIRINCPLWRGPQKEG